MIDNLIAGAKAARECSVDGMAIELVITEEGIIARGERTHRGETKRSSFDYSWDELRHRKVPCMLENAVALVSIGLRS